MSVLVTGGAGYIGSHTCVELLSKGEDIVIVDNFYNSSPDVLDKIKQLTGKSFAFYEVDMLDKEALEKVFIENRIEAVIHFAGLKAVGESVALPLLYYRTNLMSTINLCELMDKYGVGRLVFSSSATVYGKPATVPIDESFPLSTTNPYGSTKLMIERILTDTAAAHPEWSIALLRYFNPIGAHESGLIGELPNGIPNNLLPYISQVAVGKLDKLHVYGNDYPTKDGTGVRDYIHVVDLSVGHLCALGYIRQNKGVEAFNLGTGTGYSVLEIVAAYEKASGVKIPYEINSRRAGDIPECYANPCKSKELLHWEAVRDLDTMCTDSWRFTRHLMET